MPKFLLDANLSPETAEYLRTLGFDTKSVQERGLGNLNDEEVAEMAKREGRVLVTFDRDFSQSWYLAMGGKLAVVWLRLKEQRVEYVNLVLGKRLKKLQDEDFSETLIVINERGYKVVRW
ncbi:MAG: hypothetical protein G01um101416_886 [Microgenomates group bacterium Gr01-1014_16]|nr:MAG: hypothetical protein G01um101416_886 [Microgenomates group bacterium Gr01-1014_16]